MANQRPVTTCYSVSLCSHRVSLKVADQVGHSTTVFAAVNAAHKKVFEGLYCRADIYNGFGAHVRSIINYPKIGVANVPALYPASIDSTETRPPKFRTIRREGRDTFQSWLTATAQGKSH